MRIAITPTFLLPSFAIIQPDTGNESTTPADMAKSALPNTPSESWSPSFIVAIRELRLPKHSPSMKNMPEMAIPFPTLLEVIRSIPVLV